MDNIEKIKELVQNNNGILLAKEAQKNDIHRQYIRQLEETGYLKKEIAEDLSFGTICEMASKCTIPSIVDANDDRFLAPEHMTAEVQKACEESGQQIPQGIAEVAAVIYNSLAVCYAKTLKELEEKTGCRYRTIHVVGGGANAGYLNRLTAEKTGRTVLAGPTEATAIGNLAVQMITGKECSNLKDARNCIFHSFEIKQYEP